jgi:hypothetical protein
VAAGQGKLRFPGKFWELYIKVHKQTCLFCESFAWYDIVLSRIQNTKLFERIELNRSTKVRYGHVEPFDGFLERDGHHVPQVVTAAFKLGVGLYVECNDEVTGYFPA